MVLKMMSRDRKLKLKRKVDLSWKLKWPPKKKLISNVPKKNIESLKTLESSRRLKSLSVRRYVCKLVNSKRSQLIRLLPGLRQIHLPSRQAIASLLKANLNTTVLKQMREPLICGPQSDASMDKLEIGWNLLTPHTQDTHRTWIILVYHHGELIMTEPKFEHTRYSTLFSFLPIQPNALRRNVISKRSQLIRL